MITREETVYLKGIAIFLVISAHALGTFLGYENEYVRNLMGTGGVNIFFILSGYGTYVSYCKGRLNGFWNRKIRTIFLPYWIITIMFVICFRRDLSTTVLMKNLLCIDFDRNIDGTMWYMSLLIINYVLFYIIFKLELRDIVKIIFFCLLLSRLKIWL